MRGVHPHREMSALARLARHLSKLSFQGRIGWLDEYGPVRKQDSWDAARPLVDARHLFRRGRVALDVNLSVWHAPCGEDTLGATTIAAPRGGVHDDSRTCRIGGLVGTGR